MRVSRFVRGNAARFAAFLGGVGASAVALADTGIPDASAQLATITTNQSNYATAMFTLALTAVGILVGVKWIKRGRGAA